MRGAGPAKGPPLAVPVSIRDPVPDDVGVILLTNTTIASPQSYRAWMALDKLLWRFARSL
jgi:hypothetical protein